MKVFNPMIRCDFLRFRSPIEPERGRTSREGSDWEGRGGVVGVRVTEITSRCGYNECVHVRKRFRSKMR